MTAQNSQNVTAVGTMPTPLTPAATDTISEPNFGPNGLYARIITTGTATNVTVLDPGRTGLSNPGTPTPLAVPATGVRMLYIARSAIDGGTQLATLTFSGALTGVTYELYRA